MVAMICSLMSLLAVLVSVVKVCCSSSSMLTISVRNSVFSDFSVPFLKSILLFQVCLGLSLTPLALVPVSKLVVTFSLLGLVLGLVVNLLHQWEALQRVFKVSIVWFRGKGGH